MAQTFAIDDNGDLLQGPDGNLVILTGAAAVGQNCITAMRAQRNEMPYSMNTGVPYAALAFDTPNPRAFAAAGELTLGAVADVTQVVSFVVTQTGKKLYYTATIQTIYGPITING